MHSCYVASLYSDKSQFARLWEDAVSECSKGILRLLKAPWQSIPYDISCNLRVLGLPTEFTKIRTLNIATRPRQSLHTTTSTVLADIREFASSADAALKSRRDWYDVSIIACLRDVRSELGPRANRATQVAAEQGLREVVRVLEGPTEGKYGTKLR